MSLESAKEFIERMKKDEEFARQVENQKDKEERMKFVFKEGFNFSAEELVETAEEMNEDDLENISAGWSCVFRSIREQKIWLF